MVCNIRIFISIRYRYDIGVNIEISIRYSKNLNCVGGVIAWVAIFINMLQIQFTYKLLHKTNNKPRKLVDKLLKWLDSTEPTFISSMIVQSHTKCCRFIKIFFDILIIIAKYYLFDKYQNLLKAVSKIDTITISTKLSQNIFSIYRTSLDRNGKWDENDQ